jgi:hypothetical protein
LEYVENRSSGGDRCGDSSARTGERFPHSADRFARLERSRFGQNVQIDHGGSAENFADYWQFFRIFEQNCLRAATNLGINEVDDMNVLWIENVQSKASPGWLARDAARC